MLILSGAACTLEAKGEDQVVAVEAQNLTPVQMGNVRLSDLLAGLIQGNLDCCCRAEKSYQAFTPQCHDKLLLFVIKAKCLVCECISDLK